MGEVLARVKALAASGELRVSQHAFQELAADAIVIDEVIDGIAAAIEVEEYPAAAKGPSVLVMQRDASNSPIHLVWGISKGQTGPAVLITAYRPNPNRWTSDFMRRVK